VNRHRRSATAGKNRPVSLGRAVNADRRLPLSKNSRCLAAGGNYPGNRRGSELRPPLPGFLAKAAGIAQRAGRLVSPPERVAPLAVPSERQHSDADGAWFQQRPPEPLRRQTPQPNTKPTAGRRRFAWRILGRIGSSANSLSRIQWGGNSMESANLSRLHESTDWACSAPPSVYRPTTNRIIRICYGIAADLQQCGTNAPSAATGGPRRDEPRTRLSLRHCRAFGTAILATVAFVLARCLIQ
jgi:hypothetical protein